jgi:hypothetical protein
MRNGRALPTPDVGTGAIATGAEIALRSRGGPWMRPGAGFDYPAVGSSSLNPAWQSACMTELLQMRLRMFAPHFREGRFLRSDE